MAYINHDVSTMAMPSGMNRMGQFPLDMSSVYYDKASLEAYAESGSIAYVGQIVSLVDEANNKVTVYSIQDKAGTLKEVGTIPTGDTTTIDVDSNGKISLANIESLVFERDIIGEDGEATGEKENVQYQALLTKNGLVWIEPSKTTVEGLATLLDALTGRVDTLEDDVAANAEAIETIKEDYLKAADLNDYAKSADLPTKVSDLTNDAGYLTAIPEEYVTATELAAEGFQTAAQVETAIDSAIAEINHAVFEKVDEIPAVEDAVANVLYLVPNGDKLDIYALIGEEMVLIDDTDADLSGYATTEAMNNALADKVDLTVYNAKVKELADDISGETSRATLAEKALSERIDGLAAVDNATQEEFDAYKEEVTNALNLKANAADVYTKSETDTAITEAVRGATGGTDASSVLADLNAFKKAVKTEVWGSEVADDSLTGTNSRIDTISADLASATATANAAVKEVKASEAARITVSTEGNVATIDDAVLVGLIGTAQSKADGAAATANANTTSIQTLGDNLGTTNSKVIALETLTNEHTTKITTLEGTVSGHTAAIDSHTQSITNLNGSVATKAEQSALNNVAGEVAKKANSNDVYTKTATDELLAAKANSTDVYSKTEIGAIEEGKTLVDMITAAGDTSALEVRVKANEDAIAAIDFVDNDELEAAIKVETDRIDAEEKRLAGLIADNTTAINTLNGDDKTVGSVDYKVAQEVAKILNDNDASDIDTLEEIAAWIANDTTGAAGINKKINDNATAINTINNTTIPAAVADANAYTDGAIAALELSETYEAKGTAASLLEAYKVKDVDNTSLQVSTEGVASIKKVSTDLLENGVEELIFCAGNASGFIN